MKSSELSLALDVLKQESDAILGVGQRIREEQIALLMQIFREIRLAKGQLVFCGVGKSALIGQKLASTFCSLGLPSFLLHPTEAMHGDLGRVGPEDAWVFISKSGTTEELLQLLPYIGSSPNRFIGLLGQIKTGLGEQCKLVFDCSVEKEACLNNQAPTTSTTAVLAIGDAMAVLWEHQSGLTKEGFARFHPSGFLGKSLSLKVSNLMCSSADCATVVPEDSLKDVLLKMTQFPLGLCAVIDEDNFCGLIVEGDIRRFMNQNWESFSNTKAKDLMNERPIFVEPGELALDALEKMENRKTPVSVLPVILDGKFIGALRLHDLLREGFAPKGPA